jgi:serine protease Do
MRLIDRGLGLFVLGFLLLVPDVRPALSQSNGNTAKDFAHQLNDAYTGVYEKGAPSVVVIDVEKDDKNGPDPNNSNDGFDFFFRGPKEENEQPDQSEGSGFIIRPDGFIITNNHVIEGADKITVKLKDGRSFQAKMVGSDDRTDVAVIKIEQNGLPAVQFADSDQVKVGQLVCAIGTPYKFSYTFTTGVVSAKGRNTLLPDKYEDYIQTDAAINPGNSGGPLFDIDGNVIGINTLIHGLNRGLGFAISSNLAKQVSDQLILNGKIVRPWLGIIIESLGDQNRADRFKGIEKGVLVKTIQADTPASKSDLRPADVIVAVDGVAVGSSRDLQTEVLKKKIGQQINLGIWRNGKKLTVAITTEELPGDPNKIAGPVRSATPGEDAEATFGAQVQDVTPTLKKELGLKSDEGVVVTEIAPNSPAAAADIQSGDLITEVGRTQISNTESFRKALADQRGKPNLLLLLDRKGIKTYSIVKVQR